MDNPKLIRDQHDFFKTHQTKPVAFRRAALIKLQEEIIRREKDIAAAVKADFGKSEFETVILEVGIVLSELRYVIRKLHSWTKPQRVLPVMVNFPSSCKVLPEPYGSVLILSPWNYPILLVFSPLIGAIAAGNTVILKPSEYTSHTSALIAEMITKVFDPGHVSVIQGDASVSARLLDEDWDYIFLTGSTKTGKLVAEAASKRLIPYTLELGGKSPCIIDESAEIDLAARRVTWGKFINCGQSCIAPDYVLVHKSVKQAFIDSCKKYIVKAYGEDAKLSPDYARIINLNNFRNLCSMTEGQKILLGGETDESQLYLSPTLLDNPSLNTKVMQEEIFGPIMPVIEYENESDLDRILNSFDKPLAFYLFSTKREFMRKVIENHAFGGGVINDTMVHFANHRQPFGGVGGSGIGKYHGKYSFDTFSAHKGITWRANWLDITMRYPPYRDKLKTMKIFQRIFS
jgi:aldehyde dehydrogenase (NAD+)